MKTLSLCVLATLTLVSCGKSKDMPFFPSAPQSNSNLVTTDLIITEEYKSLLTGTMYSQNGNITFKEDGTVSLTKKVNVLNSSDYHGKNYRIFCDLERNGKYEIIKSANNQSLKLIIEPNEVRVLSSAPQSWGSPFEIQDEAEKNKMIESLCVEYAQEEMKGRISTRLISVSKDHLHFDHSSWFNKADPHWSLSTYGDDFTYFFIRDEIEMDVSALFLNLYQGQYQTNDKATIKLIPHGLNELVSYEYAKGDCESSGEFKTYYHFQLGLHLRMLTNETCLQLDPTLMGATMFDLIYAKDNSYIHLMLPMGNFTKVIERSQNSRL
jgi:hypothetical protein